MSDEHKDINVVNCPDCGIQFSFSKKVEDLWRNNEKTFYCPNGHSLHWPKNVDELEKLRAKVKKLETELEASKKEMAAQKKRADELATELEIWKPSGTPN